jgi:hypothetical protein
MIASCIDTHVNARPMRRKSTDDRPKRRRRKPSLLPSWPVLPTSNIHYSSLPSPQHHRQHNHHQHHRHNQQQTTRLIPRILLIATRLRQLDIRTPRVITHILDINVDGVDGIALLTHDSGDIAEELVQLADALLDVADFRLALDD